jgi:hypothetical protein
MSLARHAKRRVVVRRVVAMSHCRSVQIEGLAYKPSDRATSRQHAARKRAVWRAALETRRERAVLRFVVLSYATGLQDECPTTRHWALAPTRRTKAYQISHHSIKRQAL